MTGKIKILIVDDEVRLINTLKQRLTLRNFDVTTANNGKDALEIAKKQDFELALLDLKMPGMDGDRLLELLKHHDPFIEVVILTGHGSLESAVHCSKLGSCGYLQKPCETRELLHVLKDAYKNRVRKKVNLSEKKLSALMNGTKDDAYMNILRILKKAEENESNNKVHKDDSG